MGFFTALPGIWRFLQCVRRYKNSKMWFPHLVNGGKYLFTVCYYMTLSIWRIDKSNQSFKAAFIAIASVNSIYTTVWDVGMDWSLLDPYAKQPFLRKNLGFKKAWPYYLAMFVDPILRCTWFFYIVYAHQLQHSALMSFMLAAAEVLRRFMWCFFRMENEHVGNVGANRAYRTLPLPYRFPSETPSSTTEEETEPIDITNAPSELDLERTDTLRRRSSRNNAPPPSPMVRTITRVGRTVNQAHLQDYERRRTDDHEEGEVSGESDDEEDGEDYYERTREAEGTTRRGRAGTVGSRM
ncbi:EXS family-domain-containing protein [Tricharina praecox]|uniref:EXS family-domain-containing protein n=1 Tax=Tricharina praecox TaxID=43433 RepID=UPI002220FC11|nr:EXS family-domain-containing protein [Tricharina praecox]KAI5844189.1 EXS family-domain-containing protein [Tricharina praecox]